jgi:hypothetical protein
MYSKIPDNLPVYFKFEELKTRIEMRVEYFHTIR